jgi:diadenosine tetraphosphate (Ap4A) HIT family hydrolase
MACPFCEPEGLRVVFDEPLVRVLEDAYPVTKGHLLITPRRHAAGWGDATVDERSALMAAVERATGWASERDSSIDGFNVGWNDGPSAGQTVMHLHVHVIPRRSGDVADPRGGVRWVIPDKARYWTK